MYLNDCLMAGVLIGLGSWLRSGSESFFLVNAVVLLLWCIHKKQYRAIIYYTGVYLFFYMTWKTYQMFFIPTTAQLYEKVLFFEFNPGRAVELLEYLISFLFTQQTYGFVWLLFFVLAIFSLSQGKNRSLLLLCIVVADLICWYAQIYLIHFGTLQAFAKESGERLLMTFMPIALFYSAISPTMRASWRICVSHTRRYWLANRSTVLNRLAVLTAAVAAVIVMVPRLRAPYFGLLDDGMSLQIANRVLAGDYFYPFVVGHPFGRFFPAYWYYYVPQYALWGNNAFGFFLTNCISLVITATALFALVWQISHSRLAGAVAGLLFVLSPPIIETYYTLGKSETQLALYLSLSILCLVLAISRPIRSRLVLFTASAVFLFLSMLTKEASLIMVPITLCWIITYAWYSRGQSDSRAARRLLAWYTVVAVCFAIISRLLAYLTGVAGVSAGTYSQGYGLNGRVILNSLIGHLNLLASDFSYLPWLLIQLAIVVVWARHVLTDSKIHWMIGACVVWVGGWIGILLPWAASVQEYYLLPAALGLSAAAGLGIEMVRRFWLTRSTDRQAPSAAYLASVISLVSALVFIVCSTLNMIGNGSIQLAVDRQNAALINEISHTAPRGATVLFNIRAPHEYVVESVLHLQIIKNRPDLKIDYVSPDSLSHPSDKTLIATMTIRNTPPLSVRVAGYGPTVDRWNGSLLKLLGQHVRTTYHNAEAIPLMLVTNNAWLCPFTMRLHRTVGLISAQRLCPETPMFHAQTMQYGWDLYALQPPQTPHHHSTTIGVFRAQSATWILRNTNGPSGPVRSVPFGQPTDIPIVGDWTSSGHDGIGVFRPATREWFFDSDLDGSTDFAVTWAMMRPGDIPIVGDWDGDGTDTIGFFRPRDSSWHLRNHNSDGPEDIPIFQFGMPGDIPIVGDWNDDGKATIGVYRPSTGQIALKNSNIGSAVDSNFRIQAHQIPITMSWQPYTSAAVATFADGHWSLNYANCECTASDPLAPIEFDFGQHGDMPIAGDWGGQ